MKINEKEETSLVHFNSSSFFTSKLKLEKWKIVEQAIWATFGALIMAFAIKYFITPAEILSGGVTGVALVIGRVSGDLNSFALWNILINVPLFLFGFWKVGPKFALMSVLVIVASSTFTVVLPDLEFIKHANGDNRLIAVVAGGITLGSAFSIIYRFGASSGGTDFVATYLSTKKGISISQITLMVSIAIVVIGNAIIEAQASQFDMHVFITDSLIYTLIGLFVTKTTTEYLYPKFKKCKIEVVSENMTKIRKDLRIAEYPHAYTINEVLGSRAGKTKQRIAIICSYIERKKTIELIKDADPKSFLIVTRLTGLYGNFKVPEL